MKFYADQTLAMKNARFILEEIAEAKEGNQILILADSESYANGTYADKYNAFYDEILK